MYYLFLKKKLKGPSFVTPQNYNLYHKLPNNNSRRTLLIITKIIQSIANGTNLEKENFKKESFLIPFFDFMKNEKNNLFLFLFHISTYKNEKNFNFETNQFFEFDNNNNIENILNNNINENNIHNNNNNENNIHNNNNNENNIENIHNNNENNIENINENIKNDKKNDNEIINFEEKKIENNNDIIKNDNNEIIEEKKKKINLNALKKIKKIQNNEIKLLNLNVDDKILFRSLLTLQEFFNLSIYNNQIDESVDSVVVSKYYNICDSL
jgi:hypothetical protein